MFNCTRGTQLAKPTLWYFLAAKQTCMNTLNKQTNKIQQTNKKKTCTD